jgi:hypothetical protein
LRERERRVRPRIVFLALVHDPFGQPLARIGVGERKKTITAHFASMRARAMRAASSSAENA